VTPLAHHLFTMACNNAWANLRLDRACANEAHLRGAELAELGLDEQAIWRTL
jgi:hypothetical protein